MKRSGANVLAFLTRHGVLIAWLIPLVLALVAAVFFDSGQPPVFKLNTASIVEAQEQASKTHAYSTASANTESARSAFRKKVNAPQELNKKAKPIEPVIDWNKASGQQPTLTNYQNVNVEVSLAKQRVYIKSGSDVIYTMLASTGVDDTTPHGDFTIGMRGTTFFNPDEAMGANWWTAFRGTNYLFHSVPIDANGAYIADEAAKLGEPASHGCVRLTVADAQWFFDQIPQGTAVHIS